MTAKIAIAGWFGSDNLGDELILRSLTAGVRAVGAHPVAISINPRATQQQHGIEALEHGSPRHTLSLMRSLADADRLVVAGGLIQNETSPWNLPFHANRLWAGRRLPVGAVGLGIGRVTGRVSGRVARSMVKRMTPLVVRDAASAERVLGWGCRSVQVGADPVMGESVSSGPPNDQMGVVLRLPNRRGMGTAASKAGTPSSTDATALAAGLDAVASVLGLRIRMVAFQAGRDNAVHEAVAERLRAPTELVTPNLDQVLDEVGQCRLVITMRYHGAIAALLHGRPAVLLDYSPKMASLSAEGGRWAPLLTRLNPAPDRLIRAAEAALGVADRVEVARESIRQRLRHNRRALEAMVA